MTKKRKRLISLDEANRDPGEERQAHGPVPNGIECPRCHAELYDELSTVLLSNPPKILVRCHQCDFINYRRA